MKIEVIYALPDRQVLVALDVDSGTTVRAAIERSGFLREYPELDLARNKVGVFGALRELDQAVAAGDRIEIYRPLPADPKEMRRRRAKK